MASESDGVSVQPSIPDGNAVGNSVIDVLGNIMMMLSAAMLNCLDSESIVR